MIERPRTRVLLAASVTGVLAALLFACNSSEERFTGSKEIVEAPDTPRGAGPDEEVRRLLDTTSPSSFEQRLAREAEWGRTIRGRLAEVAVSAGDSLGPELTVFLREAARARSRRLTGQAPWSDATVAAYIEMLLLDPSRFAGDAELHEFVMQVLPGALDPAVPGELRDRLLSSFFAVLGFSFEDSEAIEVAWGSVPRSSLERELPYPEEIGHVARDPDGPIEASVYSLPSALIDAELATEFLSAVRRAAPRRPILVLVDPALHAALGPLARGLGVHLVPTHGQRYSLWPRDPFSFVRRPDGGVGLLLRPNRQAGREADGSMALELIQGLPEALDRSWGRVRWQQARIAFHNGQLLSSGERLWTSTHNVGPRIHELLADPGVDLSTPEGWSRYSDAAWKATGELERLFGRKVELVHPMTGPSDAGFVAALGGGSGFDLDSLLTLLDRGDARTVALLGDLDAGVRLLNESDPGTLDRFARAYALSETDATWRRRLLDSHRRQPARGLGSFLDMVGAHLRSLGIEVRRLPLIVVPGGFKVASELDQPFLITWNNVVLERRPAGATARASGAETLRAEGFASGWPEGDAIAVRAFAEAGYELTLFPPLIPSIVRGGGYRCASQHLR